MGELLLCLVPLLSLLKLQAPSVMELVQGNINYFDSLLQCR